MGKFKTKRFDMRIFIGNHLRLTGKTRHGKNRIRENGDLWEVITIDGQESSILSTKVCVTPLSGTENWRWIDLPSDEHIEIIEHIE